MSGDRGAVRVPDLVQLHPLIGVHTGHRGLEVVPPRVDETARCPFQFLDDLVVDTHGREAHDGFLVVAEQRVEGVVEPAAGGVRHAGLSLLMQLPDVGRRCPHCQGSGGDRLAGVLVVADPVVGDFQQARCVLVDPGLQAPVLRPQDVRDPVQRRKPTGHVLGCVAEPLEVWTRLAGVWAIVRWYLTKHGAAIWPLFPACRW